jgi:hypothetical protein
MAKAKKKPDVTIEQVLKEFLADQKARLSPRTYSKYVDIISLFKSCCESYWPGHDDEASSIMSAKGTYCGSYGPEDIPRAYSEFLNYFMPHKVICGKETMQAAGTVTKKLTKWLVARGYLADDEEAEDALEDTRRATRELPASRDVLAMLDEYVNSEPVDEQECSQVLEDHFWISRIIPGQLWLEPFLQGSTVGPVPVPEEVTSLCQLSWDISGVVGETPAGWRFLEVWNVSP